MQDIRSKWHTTGAFLILLTFFVSCKTAFLPVKAEYDNYRITPAIQGDTTLQVLMAPYKDSVDRSMNQVIGTADKTLEKSQPEGTLGNFMADAMLYGARHLDPDAAFVNYGGIRIPQLTAGEITRSKVFELMPFDNIIVVQKIKGDVLQEFLHLIAKAKGWPVAGIQFTIKDGKAINVNVGGAPLDLNKTYTIVNSDYVANGGDNAAMLKAIPLQTEGYLMRDAIFDYIDYLKSAGKPISANIENRVINAQ
jgi:2',3'-cyclic-nucleotide 2'-phosphodiesterase (5'-nucleotidase family)